MYELALFAGAGGGILGGILRGHVTVGAVEIEAYPREVLLQRQRDGILPEFPIWDDVTTFRIDNPECRDYIEMLRGVRDELVISGGFPCQDISSTGGGQGIAGGSRSGLWFEFSRIIREIRPGRVFVENSPLLVSRGLDIVLSEIAAMGYDAKWGNIGANAVGLPHKRARFWMVANPIKEPMFQAYKEKVPIGVHSAARRWASSDYWRALSESKGATSECLVLGMHDELARRVEPYEAIGNGQVPAVVDLAWEMLGDD